MEKSDIWDIAQLLF